MSRDPVTPETREAVFTRDSIQTRWGYDGIFDGPLCVAHVVARWADPCAGRTTLDHVQDGYGRMGKRAPSDAAHLVSVCWHHHLDGWATAHRPELRAYLERVNPILAGEGGTDGRP